MKLSAEQAEIIGMKEASQAECIKQLWAYLKKNSLQDPENKPHDTMNLVKIFGTVPFCSPLLTSFAEFRFFNSRKIISFLCLFCSVLEMKFIS
jgi:chromatin remodeling complex protein RSC6